MDRRIFATAGTLLLAAVALAGCGGGDDVPEAEATTTVSPASRDRPTSEEPAPDPGQADAIKKAEDHSRSNHSSESEIRRNLEAEGVSGEDIDYAIENAEISFSTNAKLAAESMAETKPSVSREEVTVYLVEVREFTEEQADAAAEEYPPAES